MLKNRLTLENVAVYIEIDSLFIDRREVIRGYYTAFEEFTFVIVELALNPARDRPDLELLNLSGADVYT